MDEFLFIFGMLSALFITIPFIIFLVIANQDLKSKIKVKFIVNSKDNRIFIKNNGILPFNFINATLEIHNRYNYRSYVNCSAIKRDNNTFQWNNSYNWQYKSSGLLFPNQILEIIFKDFAICNAEIISLQTSAGFANVDIQFLNNGFQVVSLIY